MYEIQNITQKFAQLSRLVDPTTGNFFYRLNELGDNIRVGFGSHANIFTRSAVFCFYSALPLIRVILLHGERRPQTRWDGKGIQARIKGFIKV